MKKKFLLLGVFLMASVFACFVKAQTDVTSTYLTNAGFDDSPNYLASDQASNLGSANDGVNVKDVTGWTKGAWGDNSCAASFEYGYGGTLNVSGAYGTIPAAGYEGSTGGALGLSVAWSASGSYYQNVTLAGGKYELEYAAYNSGPAAGDKSITGWVPTSGTSVLSTLASFTMGAWVVDKIDFTVADGATGKIQVGISDPANVGSGSTGRIFVDYVKLTYLGVDKSGLETKIADAQALYGDGSGIEAAALLSAIEAAQAVDDKVDATQAELLQAISALDTAMNNYKMANASDTNPVNVTNLLTNPSFETSSLAGWTNPGGFSSQTSNPATLTFTKDGTVFIEKYTNPPATLGDFSIYQTVNVPLGTYRLTVAAQARVNENGTNPGFVEGAIVYANDKETTVSTGQDYVVDNVSVATGVLTVGFKTIVGMANWVCADNFRLEYVGFDLNEIAAGLQVVVDSASLINGVMQNTVKTELAAAITAAKAAIATPTKDGLTAAAPRLAAAIAAANSSIAAYATLKDALDSAAAILPSSAKGVNGFADFSAAVNAANAIYTAATGNNDYINAATSALKTAILNFQVANASETNPADVTSWISNPGFEDNQDDYDQIIPGWTKTGPSDGNYCTRSDAGPILGTAPNTYPFKTGNVYFQYWSSSKPDFSISQDITLPNGKYTLKADAGDGGTGIYLYANDQQVQVVTGTITYSIDVVVTTGKLTIGFKSVSRSDSWAYADNFHLYYYGGGVVNTPATNAETTLVPGKSYYLYNAGADKFLAFGGNYATQAVVSQRGAPVTFTEVTDGSGTYYLQFTNANPDGWDIGTQSYLRTSDLYADQLGMATGVGIFTATKADADSYFTLKSIDTNANGEYLAANTDPQGAIGGRWGVATNTPAYGLNMATTESDYTQWYLYDVDLFNARYDLSKLLKVAGDLNLANLDEYIADYNKAETVDAVNDVINALRVDIAGAVKGSADFTPYVDDACINDGVTPVSIAKWQAVQPTNPNRRHIPGIYNIVTNGIVTAGSFEYYNTTFDFHQALSGLPQGVYELKAQAFERAAANDTAKAYIAGTEVIKTKIYATSAVDEFSKPVSSLYEHAYESSMGGSQANGYVNDMASAQGAFLEGYYDVDLTGIIVGPDGTLTIGIKKDENIVNSWTLFDNFRLIYLGDAITALKDMLAEKLAEAQACIDSADMGWFNKTELEAAIEAGNNAEETFDALTAAVQGLETAISNFNDIVARYQPLKDKIAEAKAGLDTIQCADLMQAAIDAGQAVYDNPVEQTAADIKAAIAAIGVVPVNCYLAGLGTEPTPTAPVDLTQFLANPDFEAVQTDWGIDIPGWTKTGGTTGTTNQFATRSDTGPDNGTFKHGNVYVQDWSSASPRPDFTVSQEVMVPNGYYRVVAAAGGDSGTTGTFIYANEVQVAVTTDKDYSVIVEVTDNVLDIGFKSVNRTANWAYADNFRLYYYGTEAPAEPALTIDKAKLNFFPFSLEQSFTITGENLTGTVTLTAPTGITLSKTSIPAADVEADGGATVNATFTGATFTGLNITVSGGGDTGNVTQSIPVNAFQLTGDNLIQYWSGLGAEAAGIKPNDVGWSNTTGSTIPWADANTNSGCRFRDDTPGIYIYNAPDTVPFIGRHLMLRWDGAAYYTSVYAYPVVLEAETAYKFDFDVFLGGSATGAGSISVGISTTSDDTGRLSNQDAAYTVAGEINVAPTYTFTSEAAGLYYMTFKGNNFVANTYWPWIGVANLTLVKNTDNSINSPSLSSGLLVYPTITSGVLNVNKPDGTKVFIFDMAGNKVMETTLSNPLNVGSLKAGVYIIGTATGERAKFIKK